MRLASLVAGKVLVYTPSSKCIVHTLLSRIRCIMTKLHNTSNVSIEFENV